MARNGKRLLALEIFSKALKYLKDKALERINEQSGVEYKAEEVRWVVTVPAIWKQSAKQFMREAAYEVSINCNQLSAAYLLKPDQNMRFSHTHSQTTRLYFHHPFADLSVN